MAYDGVPYILGAEGDLVVGFQPVPALDCSELVQVALADVGVAAPDGHWNQLAWCQLIDLEAGYVTPGALLFVHHGTTNGHVAISRGDGTTIEARGRAYGTGVFPARRGRAWTHAGLIPGIDYSPPAPPLAPEPQEQQMTAVLVQCDDGDIAIFTTDGILKSWVRDGNAFAELAQTGLAKTALDGSPVRLSRAALSSLALIGQAPNYPEGYGGPRTTS